MRRAARTDHNQALTFDVPVPPTTNHAYATVNGRRVLSAAGRVFKQEVRLLARLAANAQEWIPEAPWSLTLRLYFPTARRRDLSNTVKLLEDAISEALGFDDSQIDRLVVERAGVDKARPRAEVVLEEL